MRSARQAAETARSQQETALAETRAAAEAGGSGLRHELDQARRERDAARAEAVANAQALRSARQAAETARSQQETALAEARPPPKPAGALRHELDQARRERDAAHAEAVANAQALKSARQAAETARSQQQTALAEARAAAEAGGSGLRHELDQARRERDAAHAEAVANAQALKSARQAAETARSQQQTALAEARAAAEAGGRDLRHELDQARRERDAARAEAVANAQALRSARQAAETARSQQEKTAPAQARRERDAARAEATLSAEALLAAKNALEAARATKEAVTFNAVKPQTPVLSAAPVDAQGFQQFGIREAGFVFEVPPNFNLTDRAGDGQSATFEAPDGAMLEVWSAGPSDLNSVAEKYISEGEHDGWKFTYRRLTPRWASFSGVKDGRIRYFRAIAACGDRVALFLLDYSQAEKVRYDPVVVRMVRKMKIGDCESARRESDAVRAEATVSADALVATESALEAAHGTKEAATSNAMKPEAPARLEPRKARHPTAVTPARKKVRAAAMEAPRRQVTGRKVMKSRSKSTGFPTLVLPESLRPTQGAP